RFLMQEFLGRLSPSLGDSKNVASGAIATFLVVAGWTYFILTGSISVIWPMFGIANQLLACAALSVATTIILRESEKKAYALVTLLPLTFVATTTITAAIETLRKMFLPMAMAEATRGRGIVNLAVTGSLLVCVLLVIVGSAVKWVGLVRSSSRRSRP